MFGFGISSAIEIPQGKVNARLPERGRLLATDNGPPPNPNKGGGHKKGPGGGNADREGKPSRGRGGTGSSGGSAGNPAEFMHVRDEKSNGTHGGNTSAGTYHVRDLNVTAYNGITGASLASNQITLPAGTYMFDAQAITHGANRTRVFIYNVSTSEYVCLGISTFTAITINGSAAQVTGRVTIAAEAIFELRQYVQDTETNGLGFARDAGGSRVEAYAEVVIHKI